MFATTLDVNTLEGSTHAVTGTARLHLARNGEVGLRIVLEELVTTIAIVPEGSDRRPIVDTHGAEGALVVTKSGRLTDGPDSAA
jgi:hypothetical protein